MHASSITSRDVVNESAHTHAHSQYVAKVPGVRAGGRKVTIKDTLAVCLGIVRDTQPHTLIQSTHAQVIYSPAKHRLYQSVCNVTDGICFMSA